METCVFHVNQTADIIPYGNTIITPAGNCTLPANHEGDHVLDNGRTHVRNACENQLLRLLRDYWQSALPHFIEMRIDRDTPCPKCRGLGVRAYGTTATWRGGIGGAAITSDVCDACWGSGSADRPWRSWRTQ